jgi:[protein-PII] uridylyltransferase
MDARLQELFAASGAGDSLALVGVGGYGRGELSPRSDVDVVLLHEPGVKESTVKEIADAIWYPLWDDGVDLDHAVRSTRQMRRTAAEDLRAALGMLDLRHVAGNAVLSASLRSQTLDDWRRGARTRLPQLRATGRERAEQSGDLAHAAIPDLKESHGGLRDGVVLRALVATWLVDVPHAEAEECRSALLDVRDALHEVAGRATDRMAPELVPDMAGLLGTTPLQLSRHVRLLGRRTAHLAQATWRRVDQLEAPVRVPGLRRRARRPQLVHLGDGVARVGDEVVLAPDARPETDPALSLRVAALAAEHQLQVAPSTAARLARTAPDLPEPWPAQARRSFVALLSAGPAAGAGVGGARARGGRGRLAAGVGGRRVPAVRGGGAPVHGRPAQSGGLHRGGFAGPRRRPAGPARRLGPAARPRQGAARRPQRGRCSDGPVDRAADGLRH